jgi:BlaI family transcriptional regulator, penicillinase repressor
MNRIPRISDTEWEVMNVLWSRSPLSADHVIRILQAADPSWHERTVKTLLNRLIKKKALGYRKEGRAYLYRPLVSKGDCVSAVSESFLTRVFGGSLQPMIAHFAESRELSADEIAELKRLIKKTEGK